MLVFIEKELSMFAVLALLCFLLDLFGAGGFGDHASFWMVLGFAFIAAHLLYAWTPWAGRIGNRQ